MINGTFGVPPPIRKAELLQALSEPLLQIRELPDHLRRRKFLPQLLARLEHAGRLRRVRRGAYLVVPTGVAPAAFSIDPYAVTGLLGSHRAISFHSALAFRGLAESVGSRITLQTPTPFAKFTFEGVTYVPVVTRHSFGFETAYRGGVRIQVTDVERTLLDGLRNPASLGGLDEFLRSLDGVRRSDLKSPPAGPARVVSVRFEKFLEYLERFDETSLYSKAGFLLRLFEARWKPAAEVFQAIQKKVGLRKTLFPPGLPTGSGCYLREWNLIVPRHLHSRTVAATEGSLDAPL